MVCMASLAEWQLTHEDGGIFAHMHADLGWARALGSGSFKSDKLLSIPRSFTRGIGPYKPRADGHR